MQNSLYEQDLYQWFITNAELINQGKFAQVDTENLIEELEAMGRSERRALISLTSVLLAHLLKWHKQPEIRSNSWKYTIAEQRRLVHFHWNKLWMKIFYLISEDFEADLAAAIKTLDATIEDYWLIDIYRQNCCNNL